MKNLAFLVAACLTLMICSEYFLISDSLFFDFFGQQLSFESVNQILTQWKKWKWLSYIILPILLVIKISFVAICFTIGDLISSLENDFKKFISIAVAAEFVFLIPSVIKLLWFLFVKTDYTLQDIQFFSPLSMISLFNQSKIDPWLIYPIQLLNIFELLYWIALTWQLQEVLKKPFAESLGFVAKTYGIGLAVWVVFVMFLTVSISTA